MGKQSETLQAEQLTLFLEDSLARTSLPLDRTSATGKALKGKGQDSGSKWQELFGSSDPFGYWLKTCVERLTLPSTRLRKTLRLQATKSGASCYLHLLVALPTEERDSLFAEQGKMWSTPIATDWNVPEDFSYTLQRGRNPLGNGLRYMACNIGRLERGEAEVEEMIPRRDS